MRYPCIVHLDLKGAPWKIDYLCKVIQFMKAHGAWGVLIEWEDTFPYTSELISIGSLGGSSRDGMYSQDEVKYIIQCIKDNKMEPIQLVQTIGHMEFVLKHSQYKRLREMPRSPAVLCPTRAESRTLVKNMVKQIMEAQPDATYLHIGADEAWHMNVCTECQQKSQASEYGPSSLYLEHIKVIATFIKAKYPKVNILMWDDMMRSMPVEVLKAYDLGSIVQPVVWNYQVKGQFHLNIHLWERYFFVFPKLWVASAYKGANGSAQMVCSVQRYASNQLAWHEELSVYEGEFKFGGVILTGWSRYDHYATLCELLPVALPSLATCLRMWNNEDGFTNEEYISDTLPLEEWPGHELARNVESTHALRTQILQYVDGEQVTSWMNQWQLEHDYTSPMHVQAIASTANQFVNECNVNRREMSFHLHSLTGRRSAEEYVQTFLSHPHARARDMQARAEARQAAPAAVTPKSDKRRPSE